MIELSLSVERGPGASAPQARVAVRDNGPGVPSELMRKIFDQYFRAPGSEDSNVSGVGLGLSLCRHVMKAHSGRIEVKNNKGGGSTFWFELPTVESTNESGELKQT